MFPVFLTPERKKIFWGGKLIWKKIQKNFIVNNGNKTIRACYLSSKWPVSRSIVNQTNGGASRAKLSTLLKTSIYKYWALFCNKVTKYTCNKGILSIQIMSKCIFVFFRNIFPFNWKSKLVIYYFFIIILSHQTVALWYLRSWNLLFILNILIFSWLSKLFPHRG